MILLHVHTQSNDPYQIFLPNDYPPPKKEDKIHLRFKDRDITARVDDVVHVFDQKGRDHEYGAQVNPFPEIEVHIVAYVLDTSYVDYDEDEDPDGD